MAFDPDKYLEQPKSEFNPDAYLESDKPVSTFDPDSYLNQGKDLQLWNKTPVDTGVFMDELISDAELELYAKSYGVNKDDLRDTLGWSGGQGQESRGFVEDTAEGLKASIGKASNMLGFGAAGFINKKLQDDPNMRRAIDDMRQLISKKQSYGGDVIELAGGIGAATGLSKIAQGSSKLPAVGKKVYDAASAAGGGASMGLFRSLEGQEGESALIGGLFGLGVYGGIAGGVKGYQKLKQLKAGTLPEPSPELSGVYHNARNDFELDKQDGFFDTFRSQMKTEEGTEAALASDGNRAARFMEFINSEYKDLGGEFLDEARKKHVGLPSSKEYTENLRSEFAESLRAGKVTDDVIDAFLIRDNVIESLYQQNKRELQKMDIVDPEDLFERSFQQNVLSKVKGGALSAGEDNFLRSTQAFRLIDDRTGTGLEPLINKAYRANAMKSGFERGLLDKFNLAKKQQNKLGQTMEDVYDNIQNPKAKDNATEAWRSAFRALREDGNAAGLGIRDLGDTYVPQRKKNGAVLIKALEKKADELGVMGNEAKSSISFKDILRNRDELLKDSDDIGADTAKWIESLDGQSRDLAYLVHELERATKRPINNVFGIRKAVGDLRSEKVAGSLADISVGALHARDTLAPPRWLTETNVNRLFRRAVSEAGNQIFMDPVARQVSAVGGFLKTTGENRAARYVEDYVSDMMGLPRKEAMLATNMRRIKKDLKMLDDKGKTAEIGNALLEMSTKTFYASVMGMRVDNVLRNLTQTATKTVPEFGWTRGSKYLAGAYREIAADIASGGYKKALRETEDVYNLKPRTVRASDFAGIKEDIFRNVDSRASRVTNEVIDGYAQFSMKMYMASDEINRVATVNMSKRFVRDLMEAGGNPKELGKLKKVIAKWPKTLQRELDIALKNPATTAKDLTQLVAGHLVPESQVMYGTLGRARIHRTMGQVISTLSDYPHHMLSDAYYKMADNKLKGLGQLIYQYAPTAALFYGADRLLDTKDERTKETVGKGGTFGYHPLNTLSSASSIFGAPHIENVAKFGYTMVNPKHDNSREMALKNLTQSYGLFPGMAWRHGENGYDFIKAWNDGGKRKK